MNETMSAEQNESNMSEWGHTKNVSERQQLIWSRLKESWRKFTGPIPELSLDIGAALKKGRSVSLDPFPRGEVDVRAVAENLPFKDRTFSSVVMESVIKHVNSPDQSLEGVHRVLLEDGGLFLTSPINYRDHHRHSFTNSELRSLLQKNGFHIERAIGFGFSSTFLNRLLSRFAAGQYTRFRIPCRFCRVVFIVARRV
jgi:SAM-dependent methyltransferase